MISDSEIERLRAVCVAMTAAQVAVMKKKAEKARAAALQWPPFAHPEMEFFRLESAGLADDLAKGTDAKAMGLVHLLELGILASLQAPNALALDALARHLIAALNDAAVRANSGAVALVERALDELYDMGPRSTPSEIFHLMRNDAARAAVSQRSAQAARSKNIEPRAWVVTEWATRNDRKQSKASFGRQYAHLVKRKFGAIVLPETIARYWLTKAGS